MKATIYSIKEAAPNRIAIVARPRGGDWLCDELDALSREGIDVLVSMLTEEETDELGLDREAEECHAAAIKCVNLPVLIAQCHEIGTVFCARLSILQKW
jgi:hypothetical protein